MRGRRRRGSPARSVGGATGNRRSCPFAGRRESVPTGSPAPARCSPRVGICTGAADDRAMRSAMRHRPDRAGPPDISSLGRVAAPVCNIRRGDVGVNYPRLKPEACSHGGSPCYVQEASCPAIPIRLAERLLTSGRRPYSRREPERRSTARVRCGGVALGLAHRPMLPRDWREASRERGPSATGLLYHFLSTDARNGTLFIVAGSAPHAPPG